MEYGFLWKRLGLSCVLKAFVSNHSLNQYTVYYLTYFLKHIRNTYVH